jgi:hypothetical protein
MVDDSQTYVFEKLPDQEHYIRVAELQPSSSSRHPIECRILTYLTTEAPTFEAISYVCGNPDDTDVVKIGRQKLHIYRTLHTALVHFRHEKEVRTIWADALCINQSDPIEKSEQVHQIHQIYRKAVTTLAWLGDHPDGGSVDRGLVLLSRLESWPDIKQLIEFDTDVYTSTTEALPATTRARTAKTMRQISKHVSDANSKARARASWLCYNARAEDTIELLFTPQELDYIHSVGALDYFWRVWIFSEVLLSRSIVFYRRSQKYEGSSILGGLAILKKTHHERYAPRYSVPEYFFNGNWLDGVLTNAWRCLDVGTPSFVALIFSAMWTARCEDSRDRVFALRTISDDPLIDLNQPDYSLSERQVYQRLTRTYIDFKGDLCILSFCGMRAYPSWTLDPSVSMYDTMALQYVRDEHLMDNARRERQYSAAGSSWPRFAEDDGKDPSSHVLGIMGYRIGRVKQVQPKVRSNARPSLDIAPDVLEMRRTAMALGHSERAFWLTMCQDASRRKTRWSHIPEDNDDRNTFFDGLSKMDGCPTVYPNWVFRGIINFRMHGTFFTTREGQIGTCLTNTRAGDWIVVFFGSQVPYVLREEGNGEFLLVEECFLNECMDGQTYADFQDGKYDEEVFSIV